MFHYIAAILDQRGTSELSNLIEITESPRVPEARLVGDHSVAYNLHHHVIKWHMIDIY